MYPGAGDLAPAAGLPSVSQPATPPSPSWPGLGMTVPYHTGHRGLPADRQAGGGCLRWGAGWVGEVTETSGDLAHWR